MDIVERIKGRNMPYGHLALLDQAAEEIRRLRIIAADYQVLQARANEIDDCNERLQADNERLRVALRELTEQLALLAKDPKSNPWVQQGLAALAPPPQLTSADRAAHPPHQSSD